MKCFRERCTPSRSAHSNDDTQQHTGFEGDILAVEMFCYFIELLKSIPAVTAHFMQIYVFVIIFFTAFTKVAIGNFDILIFLF
jgi:hypothetical protein